MPRNLGLDYLDYHSRGGTLQTMREVASIF